MTENAYYALREKIEKRTAVVAVVGLGYVGLPLAQSLATAGFHVIGYDTDPQRIQVIRTGTGDVQQSSYVAADRRGTLTATNNEVQLSWADVVIVCVPTPLTRSGQPDLSHIEDAGKAIAKNHKPGRLVVLSSTVYPGCTVELLLPLLTEPGLSPGTDFFLAYSPERVNPGDSHSLTSEIPRVVAGIDAVSTALVELLFGSICDSVVTVSSTRVAEASKLLENTYRAVNIALVNELKVALTRMDIDIWEVIAAASTKPFGFQAFYPSPGVGGHCIPVDPAYLEWKANQLGQDTFLVNLAAQINRRMTTFVMERLEESFPGGWLAMPGSKILVLGVAYKKGVDDTRGSPAFPIMDRLYLKRAVVSYSDPHVPYLRCQDRHGQVIHMTSVPLTEELLTGQDAVIIVTDHTEFDYGLIAKHARLIIDTRNAMQCWTCNGRLVKA